MCFTAGRAPFQGPFSGWHQKQAHEPRATHPAMTVQRPSLAARAALRPLLQRSLSSAAHSIPAPAVRFQQVEWRRAWSAEEQASQSKHVALQKSLERAQAKDAKLIAKVCEDLVAAAGSNWKLEITTSAHEHGFGDRLAK